MRVKFEKPAVHVGPSEENDAYGELTTTQRYKDLAIFLYSPVSATLSHVIKDVTFKMTHMSRVQYELCTGLYLYMPHQQ